MANFTVRVELHGADDSDYESLHEEMESAGFSRTIKSDDGLWYRLPPAEYVCSGNYTRADVLAAAETAAKTTGKKSAILVTESAGRRWSGLERAD
ncbi:MAG: hypothetical protein ACREJD_08420 [Phycisphaerales bacterium]